MEAVKKEIKLAIIPGILIGMMNGIGFYVKQYGGMEFSIVAGMFYVINILVSVSVVCAFFILLSICGKRKHRVMSDIISSVKKYDVIIFFSLLFFWIPLYLCFWPGIFSYDAPDQLTMYLENEILARQPILHTLLMGKIITFGYGLFGSTKMGIGLYFVIQMMFFAFLVTYVFDFLYREKASMFIHGLAFFIFAIFPPVTILLLSATKDNYFSLFLMDFVIVNYKFIKYHVSFFEKKSNVILWVFFALGAVTFRHNTIYAMLLFVPAWIIFVIKKISKRKPAIAMLGAFVICYLLYMYPITMSVATEGLDPREMMSIPIQQVTRIYVKHGDELPAEEKQLVESVFQGQLFAQLYNPLISDMPKFCMNYELFLEYKKESIELYLEWFKRYPKEYVDSVFENTYGFWYMWPRWVISWTGENKFLALECREPITVESKNTVLLNAYQWFGNGKLAEGKTVLAFIFNPALYTYMCFALLIYGLGHNRKKEAVTLMFIMVVWLTFILGPVALVRYVMFIYILIPVELVMVGLKNGEKTNQKQI